MNGKANRERAYRTASDTVLPTALLGLAFGWPLAALVRDIISPLVIPIILSGMLPLPVDDPRGTKSGAAAVVMAIQQDWHLPALVTVTCALALLAVWPVAHAMTRARSPWIAFVAIAIALPMAEQGVFTLQALALPYLAKLTVDLGLLASDQARGLLAWLHQAQSRTGAALPFGILVLLIGYQALTPSLHRMAVSLGAGSWLRFRLIIWPLCRLWLLGAWAAMTVIAVHGWATPFGRSGPFPWASANHPDMVAPMFLSWMLAWLAPVAVCLLAYGWLHRQTKVVPATS